MSGRNDPYTAFAGIYDPLTRPFLDPIRRSMADLVQELRLERVLDLCCGTGRLCSFLIRGSSLIVGLDNSPAMLRVAGSTLPRGIELILADAAAAPLRAQAFDGVILALALHEKDRRERGLVLQNAVHALRPGGFLFILDMHAGGPSLRSRSIHALMHGIERLAGKAHYACFKAFLQDGGLGGLLARSPELRVTGRRWFKAGNLELLTAQRL